MYRPFAAVPWAALVEASSCSWPPGPTGEVEDDIMAGGTVCKVQDSKAGPVVLWQLEDAGGYRWPPGFLTV